MISYPYMLRALTAGYQAYGEQFDLCARNLGASSWRTLLAIELPLLLPALLAGATIVFLVAFSEYFLVFLIGGGTVPSYSGYIFPLLNSSDKSVASLLDPGLPHPADHLLLSDRPARLPRLPEAGDAVKIR